jgi:hypothetical protein
MKQVGGSSGIPTSALIANGGVMVDIRRRFELYVALTKILKPEIAAFLMQHLQEIERDPAFQRWNRDRIEANPAAIYSLYAVMRSRIGQTHTTTLFEMLDPIGWSSEVPSDGPDIAPVAAGAVGDDHGGR